MVAQRITTLSPSSFVTPEEYLAQEREAVFKSEYRNGVIVAMAGASESHNLIAGSIYMQARAGSRERGCRVYTSDMRVKAAHGENYTYPDISIVCGPPQFEGGKPDTLVNPTVIVEVLSPSTADYDRSDKFRAYQQIESLREYVLVLQERVQVERYVRRENGIWMYALVSGIEASVTLEAVAVTLNLAEVYEGITFPVEPS